MNTNFLGGGVVTRTLLSDVIQVLKRSGDELKIAFRNLPKNDRETITEQQRIDMFKNNLYTWTASNIIEDLALADFNAIIWQALSIEKYKNTAEYAGTVKNKPETQAIFDFISALFPNITVPQTMEVLLIGDFSEAAVTIELINNPSYHISNLHFDWKAFTENPYENKIVDPITLYDNYVNEKYYVRTNDANADKLWIAEKQGLQAHCIFGATKRNNYFDQTETQVLKWFKNVVTCIAAVKPGLFTVLKLAIPTNLAMLGLFGFVQAHFEGVTLLKLYEHSPDDDTCYLFCSGAKSDKLDIDINNNQRMLEALWFFSQLSNDVEPLLQKLRQKRIDWIQGMEQNWKTRAI